jgi:hypothetical protein
MRTFLVGKDLLERMGAMPSKYDQALETAVRKQPNPRY